MSHSYTIVLIQSTKLWTLDALKHPWRTILSCWSFRHVMTERLFIASPHFAALVEIIETQRSGINHQDLFKKVEQRAEWGTKEWQTIHRGWGGTSKQSICQHATSIFLLPPPSPLPLLQRQAHKPPESAYTVSIESPQHHPTPWNHPLPNFIHSSNEPALSFSSSFLEAVTEISAPGRRLWTPRKLKTWKKGGEAQGFVFPEAAVNPPVNRVSSFSMQFLWRKKDAIKTAVEKSQ